MIRLPSTFKVVRHLKIQGIVENRRKEIIGLHHGASQQASFIQQYSFQTINLPA
jgi:hypothetical protein